MESRISKIILFIELLFLIYILGVLGYVLIEEYSLLNACYMTAITISTVGFSEVQYLSPAGKVFTIILIFIGTTIVIYGLSSVTGFFIEGELKNFLKGVRMEKKIKKLKNHYIICGCGRTGLKILKEFLKLKKEFVMIEMNEEKIEEIQDEFGDTVLVYKGDATKDETLIEAGIKTAKVLIGVLPSDAENVFLSLTAKDLNPDIKIVTKSLDDQSEKKLKKSGADHIISPIDIAAKRIVSTATRPGVVSFVDIITKTGIEGLKFELVKIEEGSDLRNVLLKDARIPQKTNLNVIGIQKNEKLNINPMSMTLLEEGDQLFVLGTDLQINNLKEITSGRKKEEYLKKSKLGE